MVGRTATAYPTNHTDGAITWISSNTQYITIMGIDSNTGLYRAVAVGNTVIAAQVGNVSTTIEVTMYNPEPQYITTQL